MQDLYFIKIMESVQFAEGVTKIYDLKPLLEKFPAFYVLKKSPELFYRVCIGEGGYGIVWIERHNKGADVSRETPAPLLHNHMLFTAAPLTAYPLFVDNFLMYSPSS